MQILQRIFTEKVTSTILFKVKKYKKRIYKLNKYTV